MSRGRILVVDDKQNMLRLFAEILGPEYELATAGEGAHALELIAAQEFDVVVTDLKMPGADGFAVLKSVKAHSPLTEVVMMTAYASVTDAVEAMRRGAYDYLQKPFDPDAAALVVARALERKRLKEQAQSLQQELQGVYGFEQLIGKSAPMQQVFALLKKAAAIEITVLLSGETGTGKELAARAIHYQSARKDRPFVPINCGALPADLIESELFGHARGAFSGAIAAKRGLFEEASGGTLFLDEIGELPLAVQVKLNRALQEREIRRVGDNTPIKVDVRVIAATHRDLAVEKAAGRFREDLYYRLHVFPVHLPPLKRRREDIPLLVAHFFDKHARKVRPELTGFAPEALRVLLGHAWPGNVRELENAIERAVAVAVPPLIEARDLPAELGKIAGGAVPVELFAKMTYRDVLASAREQVSRDYLAVVLRECLGNVTRAAERAGIERESLHRLLKRYGLRSEDFKPAA